MIHSTPSHRSNKDAQDMPIDFAHTSAIRVWIARFEQGWHPRYWDEVPPTALIVEPAVDRSMSLQEAALFIEGFNREALANPSTRRWAIARPVSVQYQGDLSCGDIQEAHQFLNMGSADPSIPS